MTPTLFDLDPRRSAVLSPCGLYRYILRRGASHGTDAERDDPTVRRCISYAMDWVTFEPGSLEFGEPTR